MVVKLKKCKICNKEFIPRSSLNKYCSYDCNSVVIKKSVKKSQKKIKLKKIKVKITTLKNKADELWRKVGKEKAVCEICVTYPEMKVNYTQLQAHHIVGRINKTLRWDLQNRAWLCPTHHTFGIKSAHNDPKWFLDYLIKHRIKDLIYIENNKNKITIINEEFVLEKINEMQKLQPNSKPH